MGAEGRLTAVERTSENVSRLPAPHGARRADTAWRWARGYAGFSTFFPSGSTVRVQVQTKDRHRSVPYLKLLPGKKNASNLSGSHTLSTLICDHVCPHPRSVSCFLVAVVFKFLVSSRAWQGGITGVQQAWPDQRSSPAGGASLHRHRAPTGTPAGVTPRTLQGPERWGARHCHLKHQLFMGLFSQQM